ncbi:hypothetical protein AB0395_46360 [Streptosporangium sp. NPDC051023]|uniref:hypothetical protein n=1 Tax=Streptosporangium sp. NPDC051023 TaxID=3155410 RepID=UPI00344FAE53
MTTGTTRYQQPSPDPTSDIAHLDDIDVPLAARRGTVIVQSGKGEASLLPAPSAPALMIYA